MARLHLWGHMDKNFVKKGDRVKAYQTTLGTIGTGNGQWYAHNHQSESEGVSIRQLLTYYKVDDLDWISKHYFDPMDKMDVERAYGQNMDVGNAGYGFKQRLIHAPFDKKKAWHPGVDINGFEGGNTDFGMPFKSHINGTVVYALATWNANGGWGNVIIVQEDEELTADPVEPVETVTKSIDSAFETKNKAFTDIEKLARQIVSRASEGKNA